MSGTVVISLDAELGWGYRDRNPFPTARVERARTEWRRLVDLFDRFEIPATWAVVGHLLLDEADGIRTDHPTLTDWPPRDEEPFSRPELWFADGLVEAVVDADAAHEIGSHSFSHVEFDEVSREIAYAEVAAAAEAAAESGLPFDSFVFPRNGIAHRDVLAEWGLRCYRGRSPIAGGGPALTRPIRNVLSGTAIGSTPLLVEPTVDEYGLVNVPASLFLFSFEGLARRACTPIIGDPVVRKAKRGIDQAVEGDGGMEGGHERKGKAEGKNEGEGEDEHEGEGENEETGEDVFHLWLHPNDIRGEYAVDRIETILAYLDERRRETDLSVETMGTVAQRYRFGKERQPANRPSG